MATDNFWGKFRRWRRHRPFWGGLFLVVSSVELFISANMSIGGMKVHLGPQGFLSYLLPVLLLICGLLAWFSPAQRLFYGIVALLAALYSFIGLNLGGFGIGMLLGILGGALLIAWGPPRPSSGTSRSGPPENEPTDHDEDLPVDVGDDIFNQHHQSAEAAGHDSVEVAGHDDRPPPRSAMQRLGRNPRAIVAAIVPLAATATILVIGSTLPASAEEECPKGMPSREVSTPASAAVAARKTHAVPKKPTTPPATKSVGKPAASHSSSPAASSSPSGNPVVDGINDFVDGVSNLLGIGEASPSPSKSPSPSESHSPSTDPSPAAPSSPAATVEPTVPASIPTAPGSVAPLEKSPASSPSAGNDDIPCLGPRVLGKVASADDIPLVAKKPGKMEVDSLTMYKSTYDGVVDMPVQGGGSFRALKFSMDKAVNKPFTLTIDEPTGGTTVISSKELITDGTVRFYTPEFKGKLYGVFPVTFTPDSPPPLTLPVLWFTDVTIQLAYVRSDVLTGFPLHVQGKA